MRQKIFSPEEAKARLTQQKKDYVKRKRQDPSWCEEQKAYMKAYWSENKHKYQSKGWKLRFNVLSRDNFTCQYCGRPAPHVQLQVDHIIPVSRGGPTKLENLITACYECNIGKSDSLLKK